MKSCCFLGETTLRPARGLSLLAEGGGSVLLLFGVLGVSGANTEPEEELCRAGHL